MGVASCLSGRGLVVWQLGWAWPCDQVWVEREDSVSRVGVASCQQTFKAIKLFLEKLEKLSENPEAAAKQEQMEGQDVPLPRPLLLLLPLPLSLVSL